MADVEKDLEDEGYIRWVQSSTCLGLAKESIESFALQRSNVLHQNVKTNLKDRSSEYDMCKHPKVVKVGNKWEMNCKCSGCQSYIDALVSLCYKDFTFSAGNWNNADIRLWPTDPWEMAKVYMNPNQKANQTSPQETDLSGILNFLANCYSPLKSICYRQNIKSVRNFTSRAIDSYNAQRVKKP